MTEPTTYGEEVHATLSELDSGGTRYLVAPEGYPVAMRVKRHSAAVLVCQEDTGALHIVNLRTIARIKIIVK